MKGIYIVCVLYNKYIHKIGSYEQFMNITSNYNHVQLVIVDNSTGSFIKENTEQAKNIEGIVYISNGGNVGLSGAYNRGLEYIKKEANEAYMLIADDDTFFSTEYLEQVVKACGEGKAKIISGMIYDGNKKCLSPNSQFDWLGREKFAVKTPGVYKNIYCFNSGVCIDIDLLENLGGFDNRLFVDMIDYWLMDSLIENNQNEICIVEGEILQEFSGTSFDNMDSVMRRYHIFKKDFETYCELCHKPKRFRWYYGNRRKINVLVHILMKGRFDLLREL